MLITSHIKLFTFDTTGCMHDVTIITNYHSTSSREFLEHTHTLPQPFQTSPNSLIRVSRAGHLLPSRFFAFHPRLILGQSSLCLASSHSSCTPWELPMAGRSQSPSKVSLATLPTPSASTCNNLIEMNSQEHSKYDLKDSQGASWRLNNKKYSLLNHFWLTSAC